MQKIGKKRLARFVLVLVLVVAACSIVAFAAGEDAERSSGSSVVCIDCDGEGCDTCDDTGVLTSDSNMAFTFWALVPPVIAIVLALVTKEVYSSLFIGIIAGALFFSNFNPVKTLDTIVNDGLISGMADSWNAGIFIFLVLLGIMVALINKAGGSASFGHWAKKNIKTRTGAMFATFLLGVLIFIDDYFNCLTVGSVMRPITDSHKVSRAKLSYLIDATAAPVCMIAPISSWAAAVAGMVEGEDGISLFIRAIPFNFYSILTFVFIIAIILMKFDYGPMKLHESNAVNKGDIFSSAVRLSDNEEATEASSNSRVIDLILPIALLVAFCVIGMIYVGGFFNGESFVTAFAETDASAGLPWGALVALVITMIYLICRRVISFKDSMECVTKGFIAMAPALLILTFAITLKNMTGLLGADVFVATAMKSAAAGLSSFLPAIIFLVAIFLSFSTGTSWGTFGILIPIVTAAFAQDSPFMIIGISACLAGAVCGDHCSPISDTTIMSSAGAQCDHVVHVSTQLPYAVTVAVISFVSYVLCAFIQNPWILLPISMLMMVGTLFVIKRVTVKKG